MQVVGNSGETGLHNPKHKQKSGTGNQRNK